MHIAGRQDHEGIVKARHKAIDEVRFEVTIDQAREVADLRGWPCCEYSGPSSRRPPPDVSPWARPVAIIVSVADVTIMNIGAPFWDLVFVFAASWLLERRDHALPGA